MFLVIDLNETDHRLCVLAPGIVDENATKPDYHVLAPNGFGMNPRWTYMQSNLSILWKDLEAAKAAIAFYHRNMNFRILEVEGIRKDVSVESAEAQARRRFVVKD